MTVAELEKRLRELEPGSLVIVQDVSGCCAYPLHSVEPASYHGEGPRIGRVEDPEQPGGEPAALLIPG